MGNIISAIVSAIINICWFIIEVLLIPVKLIIMLFAACCGGARTGYWYTPWSWRLKSSYF